MAYTESFRGRISKPQSTTLKVRTEFLLPLVTRLKYCFVVFFQMLRAFQLTLQALDKSLALPLGSTLHDTLAFASNIQLPQAGRSIVIGDSMVKGLKTEGVADYRQFKIFSFSGFRVEQLGSHLHLLDLDFKPVNIFILAGTNNMQHLHKSPAAIFSFYEKFIADVKDKFPHSNIQVLSILPRGYAPPFKNKHLDLPFMPVDVINSKICKVNNLLQVNAVRLGFTFIDIYNEFLVGPLTVDETLYCYNDRFGYLHLGLQGYNVL